MNIPNSKVTLESCKQTDNGNDNEYLSTENNLCVCRVSIQNFINIFTHAN